MGFHHFFGHICSVYLEDLGSGFVKRRSGEANKPWKTHNSRSRLAGSLRLEKTLEEARQGPSGRFMPLSMSYRAPRNTLSWHFIARLRCSGIS